ncbi:unnamed protein product [Kuraishia capsulata CBS 1993]|uniref:Uncharacterized protein n=1 Tax=Kuraishia capsulata CBS 1993 TaxID=1382522 RepID=W6MTR0_9ASCO|nr:uncharacterized protein KUCA_T00001157001 [Kuraishia capsulata CBS 1993]CDK25190.1 unnamed protein product [Kuraishia capsulata CBS 1993]
MLTFCPYCSNMLVVCIFFRSSIKQAGLLTVIDFEIPGLGCKQIYMSYMSI